MTHLVTAFPGLSSLRISVKNGARQAAFTFGKPSFSRRPITKFHRLAGMIVIIRIYRRYLYSSKVTRVRGNSRIRECVKDTNYFTEDSLQRHSLIIFCCPAATQPRAGSLAFYLSLSLPCVSFLTFQLVSSFACSHRTRRD